MIEAARARIPAEARRALAGVVVTGVIGGLLATNLAFTASDTSSVHPAALAVIMGVVVVFLAGRISPNDPTLRWILYLGFAAKLIGMIARHQVSIKVYGGLFDAGFYHESGSQVAAWMRDEGFVSRSDPRVDFRQTGTTNLAYSVGWLYYLTGPRVLTAFVAAASMSYLGLLAFVRAGIEAVPNLDRHRFAALVVFLPTLVYWPSSLGKEAWMLCWLGVGALGTARVCRGIFTPASLVPLIVGFGAAAWVRPHIGALGLAALVGALLWPTGMKGHRVQQILALALVSLALVFALSAVADTFDRFINDETNDFVAILEGTSAQTTQGGSAFEARPVTDPSSFLRALLAVLFRPFPWEADSAVQALTSLEGLALLGLAVWSRKRIAVIPKAFMRSAYVRFAVVYSVGFVIAYANIGNFGILARQRSQLWPVLLILLCLLPASPGAPGTLVVPSRAKRSTAGASNS